MAPPSPAPRRFSASTRHRHAFGATNGEKPSSMNTHSAPTRLVVPLALAALLLAGCGRQTRGNADAQENRAAAPAEGGATSTAGSAGESKNFGDTRAKTEVDGRSPSASPTGLSQDTKPEHNVSTPASGASTAPQSSQGQNK